MISVATSLQYVRDLSSVIFSAGQGATASGKAITPAGHISLAQHIPHPLQGARKAGFAGIIGRTIICISYALISGCATQEAKIAIPVSCLREAPPAMPQTLTEAEILAMSDYAATLQTYTERLLLKAYSAKADALLRACGP